MPKKKKKPIIFGICQPFWHRGKYLQYFWDIIEGIIVKSIFSFSNFLLLDNIM
jgi:hypothetical protein